ncbi:hypothetical protein JCM10207_003026 [Rhodosporidiobolus poonsookiae]
MPAQALDTVSFDADISIPQSNPSFVFKGKEHAEYEDRPVPDECGPNHVIVAPKAITICGSDVHLMFTGRIGGFVPSGDVVLGHETSGIVVRVGSAVTTLKAGDRVALEPGESCRVCAECKGGVYQRCGEMIFAGGPVDGTLCGRYILPADLCYPLPDSMSLAEGALIEPLSVGVHAISNIAQMRGGANVVVFGAGPVGLLTAAAAKALGAARVVIVDVREPRLLFAKEQGMSDEYYLPSSPQEGEAKEAYPPRNAEEIKRRFGFTERGPAGVDLVVDCSGAEVCIQTACHLLKHGGTLVQVGMGKAELMLPIHLILNHELTLKGSFRYGPGAYSLALSLVARGLVNLKPIISHRYAFSDAMAGYRASERGVGEDGRPVIKCLIEGPGEGEGERLEFGTRLPC